MVDVRVWGCEGLGCGGMIVQYIETAADKQLTDLISHSAVCPESNS